MKAFQVLIILLVIVLSSCSKCKYCYIDEIDTSTGIVHTSSIGKKCGNELEDVDGKTYITPSGGTAKTYCK